MASDEERLAALRAEESKAQFFGWLDEWFNKKSEEVKAADPPPKRTTADKPGGFFSLFGGL